MVSQEEGMDKMVLTEPSVRDASDAAATIFIGR